LYSFILKKRTQLNYRLNFWRLHKQINNQLCLTKQANISRNSVVVKWMNTIFSSFGIYYLFLKFKTQNRLLFFSKNAYNLIVFSPLQFDFHFREWFYVAKKRGPWWNRKKTNINRKQSWSDVKEALKEVRRANRKQRRWYRLKCRWKRILLTSSGKKTWSIFKNSFELHGRYNNLINNNKLKKRRRQHFNLFSIFFSKLAKKRNSQHTFKTLSAWWDFILEQIGFRYYKKFCKKPLKRHAKLIRRLYRKYMQKKKNYTLGIDNHK